jgi:hypothetical protein
MFQKQIEYLYKLITNHVHDDNIPAQLENIEWLKKRLDEFKDN